MMKLGIEYSAFTQSLYHIRRYYGAVLRVFTAVMLKVGLQQLLQREYLYICVLNY